MKEGRSMQSDISSLFQPGIQIDRQTNLQGGPRLHVELVSAHARIGGDVHLGTYSRLSDMLNFHEDTITLADGVVLNRTGIPTTDGSRHLEVRSDALTIVLDRSDYVPPPDPEAIEKRAFRMVAVTDAHVVTGTFYIYPSAEPMAYLRAKEPHWLALTDVNIRWLVDRRVKFRANFAVLNRSSVVTAAVV
jgi:hypothetical protein